MSTVVHLEPYADLKALADYLGCSKRWVESRVYEDGMPTTMIAGKHKVKVTEAEPWLRKEGYIA